VQVNAIASTEALAKVRGIVAGLLDGDVKRAGQKAAILMSVLLAGLLTNANCER